MTKAAPQSTTRRALLSAAPAITALTIPAVALASQATATGDEELVRLGQEWSQLIEVERTTGGEIERIWEQADLLPAPQALYHRPGIDRIWFDHRESFTLGGPSFALPADEWAVEEWRKVPERIDRGDWFVSIEEAERTRARAEEIVSAWEDYKEAKAQLRKSLGVDALQERMRETQCRIADIEERIGRLQARTLQGVAVKARLYELHAAHRDPEDYDAKLFASLMRDLVDRT